ncbi:oligosaccharide flippase family protein [Niallia sp. Man26]|uniref:oligosaccharide flippase family protein n=1 Tax=Niallia sp. Man26 TaxID=2912824 RepID=UPI001EDC4F8F|nr:oligosaccharide flippase family protein [Niallia sp. Man26]UPO87335.1 oligosaccharide flippase family protein [Niallia sp. Man26]
MRAKRSLINLSLGLISQLLIIALGILIPRLLLVNFGSEVNGLLSSIGQIIVYMTLLEAGVGAASLQALYKHVAGGDRANINSILSATSSYYKKTGIYYFICIILIAILYPLFIDASIDNITIMFVILVTGMGGAINFYFQGTYKVFLIAEGKSYIDTSITTIINILINAIKIVFILKGYNIIAIQTTHFILMILQIVIYQIYINRNYKWLNLKVKPDFDAISQKKSVLIHQVSYLIFNNSDVLILTIFTNLKVVSVYVLYNMLFTVLDNIINMVNSSVTFALGQTFHESRDKFLKLYNAYEVCFMSFVFSLFTVAYIMILPFMDLYTNGITDINYIDVTIPILFVALKLLVNARATSNNVINIAGHFKKTQNRAIFECVINLVCSIILVQFFGIYGVLIGTIIALLYRAIDIVYYANKKILERTVWITIRRWITNIVVFLLIVTIAKWINIYPSSYISIFIIATLLLAITVIIFASVNSLIDRDVFLYTKEIIIKVMNQFKRKQSSVK